MMKVTIPLLVVFGLSLFACDATSRESTSAGFPLMDLTTEPLRGNTKACAESTLLPVFDEGDISEDHTLYEVSQVKEYRGRYYALSDDRLFVIEASGKISKVVGGPEDYQVDGVQVFAIDTQHDRLVVKERVGKDLVFLDMDGNFQYKKIIPWLLLSSDDLAVGPRGDRFLFFRGPGYRYIGQPEYELVVVDTNFNLIHAYFETRREFEEFMEIPGLVSQRIGDTIIFHRLCSDTIYQYVDNGLQVRAIAKWTEEPYSRALSTALAEFHRKGEIIFDGPKLMVYLEGGDMTYLILGKLGEAPRYAYYWRSGEALWTCSDENGRSIIEQPDFGRRYCFEGQSHPVGARTDGQFINTVPREFLQGVLADSSENAQAFARNYLPRPEHRNSRHDALAFFRLSTSE